MCLQLNLVAKKVDHAQMNYETRSIKVHSFLKHCLQDLQSTQDGGTFTKLSQLKIVETLSFKRMYFTM